MESTSDHVDSCPFNILSLCSGAAGLDLGIRLALRRSRTICYVEREAYACGVLAARMRDKVLDEAPIWTDLKTFDGRPWRGVVHCLTAGYPCQPFSIIGQKAGTNDPRHLWPYIAKLIDDIRPGVVFVENVANHLNIGFRDVRNELCGMGYRVAAGLFTAAEVGAPHKRTRLFALGYSESRSIVMPGSLQGREVQAGGCDLGLDAKGGQETGIGAPFPPGRRYYKEWAEIIGDSPRLKPGFLDVADELAAGVEPTDSTDKQARLRLVGNGVVPSCAAYAFCILGQQVGLRG